MFKIEKLSKNHSRDSFDCGNSFLNEFLKKYALQNQNRYYVGTTYIISNNEKNVIAYITLSGLSIKKAILKEKYPYEELPALLIARLAVDKKYQKKGLGKILLTFAIKKALKQAEEVGCIGILVDAKEEAISFYEKYGFEKIKSVYPVEQKMFLSIKTIKKGLSEKKANVRKDWNEAFKQMRKNNDDTLLID